MATTFRPPSLLHGVPARLGVVLIVAGTCGWSLWPRAEAPALPPALTMDGKHGDRLAFSRDETEIPVRESRIYDTIAMFAQPHSEPRAWSEAPMPATVAEAGIRPAPLRIIPPQRVASRAAEAKAIRTAAADHGRSVAKVREPESLTVLGWALPGSQYLPSGREAARAFDRVGSGAVSLGAGTVQAVSTTASSVGNGVARAGSAIANTLGL